MRLLFITDFTEQFAYRLLRGILQYADETEPWVVCKMPPAYKRRIGMPNVVTWAKQWRADVVIGQFSPQDDITLFHKEGIVVIAQDYIRRFEGIPNITADYALTGAIVAKRFLSRGFKYFGFFGYNNVCWSDERMEGFRKQIEADGYGKNFSSYNLQQIENLWVYNLPRLEKWLRSLPKPVAIMACDDNQGSILLQVCNSLGIKVPSEAAVIGVDNDEVLCSLSHPALSSVNVDIEGGGYMVAKLADRMVKEGDFKGEDIVLRPVTLMTRMSSNVFATDDSAVLSALQFISANVDKKIIVEDVLREVPLSRRLLEQRFLKVTGTTVYKYISEMRMNRFAELLLSTKDSIADIAARLDEPDSKSLSRRFVSIKGCTPTEFRKRELRKLGV